MSDAFPPPPPPPPSGGSPVPNHGWARPVNGAVQYAGFWARVAALIIDLLVVGIPLQIASRVLSGAVPTEVGLCQSGSAICDQPTGAGWLLLVMVWLAELAAGIAYWAYLEGVRGQTLGKQALGIMVIDHDTGHVIGPGRAIGRYFARIISTLVMFLGYFWMLWDPEKQTWHDKLVRSVVVKV